MKLMKLVMLPALLATLVACGGEPRRDHSNASEAMAARAVAPASDAQAPVTGRVIEVRMITDEKGNYFAPAELEAHQGDVLRFTLVGGVHNVHFTPERNPGITDLPAMSDMLQVPGQTYDLPLNVPAGTYGFQCDPHEALGMVGTLKVE